MQVDDPNGTDRYQCDTNGAGYDVNWSDGQVGFQ